jgi:hypothetical protein
MKYVVQRIFFSLQVRINYKNVQDVYETDVSIRYHIFIPF